MTPTTNKTPFDCCTCKTSTMAAIERARSSNALRTPASGDSLAAPGSRATSKGPESSTVSIASSDGTRDDTSTRSDTSSSHRRRMSRMFKGRSSRRKSATSQDDVAHFDSNEVVPPLPDVRRPSAEPRNLSDDSFGMHRSVASSLLTEDSESDAS